MKDLVLSLLLIIAFSFSISAQIINIPADYPSIQEGIDAAFNGDTILVDTGTYHETINYLGKNITVGSKFLLTNDTTFISKTIISGNRSSTIVIFENNETSDSYLCGFTITGGGGHYGGGISIYKANPKICNTIIYNNNLIGYYGLGGGVLCFESNSYFENVKIQANESSENGGGIAFVDSDVILNRVDVTGNIAQNEGGGIYCENSVIRLDEVNVLNNTSTDIGGGIRLVESDIVITNSIISENRAFGIIGGQQIDHGGGLYLEATNCELKNATITNNFVRKGYGGGLYIDENSNILFDSTDRSNIHSNSASIANDIYFDSDSLTLNIIVDTFSVLYPTDFYAEPSKNFTFNIINYIKPQVNADLYVSPSGDNSNSGLNKDEPLQTIHQAFSMIRADQNHHDIYLGNGIYNDTINGESFPVIIPDHLSLIGETMEEVILDAGKNSSVIRILRNDSSVLSNLTVTSSYYSGSGIYCSNSKAYLNKINSNNNGNGIRCYDGELFIKNDHILSNNYEGIVISNSKALVDNSSVMYNNDCGIKVYDSEIDIKNSTIRNNSGNNCGGIEAFRTNVKMQNVGISYNLSSSGGSAIYCSESKLDLKNVFVTNNMILNEGNIGAAIHCTVSELNLINTTISDNTGGLFTGGLYLFGQETTANLINSIVWNNEPEEIALHGVYDTTCQITVNYSDIKGGKDGIVLLTSIGKVHWLDGNLNADPFFKTLDGYKYALALNSPCVDFGTPDTNGLFLPAFDITGNPRVWNDRIDMGVYEWSNLGFRQTELDSCPFNAKVFPNPVTSILNIEFELNYRNKCKIELINLLSNTQVSLFSGKMEAGKHRLLYNASDLQSGIYLIKIQCDKKFKLKKFVKY